MMVIRPILTEVRYVTTDGEKFNNRNNAVRRQDTLDFTAWYASIKPPEGLTSIEIYDWLLANQNHLRKWFEAQR